MQIQGTIVGIYHREDGVPGYRMVNDDLKSIKIIRSDVTIHNHMKELGLHSIVRRKKPASLKGISNKIFPNPLNPEFDVLILHISFVQMEQYVAIARLLISTAVKWLLH